jgi:hypothetical protein
MYGTYDPFVLINVNPPAVASDWIEIASAPPPAVLEHNGAARLFMMNGCAVATIANAAAQVCVN